MILTVTLLTSCVKLLLIPSYRSTDFEVHRNWLALTHSLPVDKWYYEETSEWTLDYPPFFGWFEYLMSFVAAYFDKNMLKVHNTGYSSEMTVLFQRLSVIVSDFVYFYGVHKVCEGLPKGWKKEVVLPILLVTNCGLMMVDHIHFQYNGIMYGIMLLSIAAMWKENYKWAAFWFSFLLNMKHIYIYLAPAYFIYLLKHYCFSKSSQAKTLVSKIQLNHLLGLGAIVIGVFAVSFVPFVYHIPQVLSRLFPFKRGLCHAYWAPNVWAIYNTFDKGLSLILPKFGIQLSQNNSTLSITRGLVQEFTHSVLPTIRPSTTMALTVLFIVPLMGKLFVLKKDPLNFLRCLVLSGLTSFLFGWHVHEKAILMIIIPLCILSVLNQRDAKIFLMLATIGHYSLFPLLFPVSLIFVKILLLILYTSYAFYVEYKIHLASACRYSLPLLNIAESLYLLGLTLVFFYENVIHKLSGLDSKLPFLPLMLTSFYCSLGVVYCWARYYFQLLHDG
ncbi:dolichyl pyrophosphate Glc1Man9GlcNAc2 alpha-1,3-glucosyltransferase [Euwallacea similis]|uniref:dolichyl pyrophosphate Glc1Man9GlcNAc2 alpha-1,3-glucosyltransferase n=1 Tax=Euwallacea similis TaxID=1736056 RepID=UPI00344C6564